MAFDQNLIPKDLRPLNVTRTVVEDPRIVPVTSSGRSPEGLISNPLRESGSPMSLPVVYPVTVPDAGFAGRGYGNVVPGVAPWRPIVPTPVGHLTGNPAVGFGYTPNSCFQVSGNSADLASCSVGIGLGCNPNLVGNLMGGNGYNRTSNDNSVGSGICSNSGSKASGNTVDQLGGDYTTSARFSCNANFVNRVDGSTTDQVSEEGGDSSSKSGKKIKFLCSFGGKIFPRPSDGMLRYVGGQTRIISVRRDVSFDELVQKMTDIYGQPVIIKYQLPDEDLDALVSVSCSDDLDNMIDEYEKLVERSSDGSGKLRVFLFSASEFDPSGMASFRDMHDSGQRYVDAVNGIMDGIGGGGITRKESTASATSTQNSDFSGNDAVDGLSYGQGNVTTMSSPTRNSGTPHVTSPRLVNVDPLPAVLPDASPPQASSSQPVPVTVTQQLMGGIQQPGINVTPTAPHTEPYLDTRQEAQMDYIQFSPHLGFQNLQLLGTGGPMFCQQQFHENATGNGISHNQFVPTQMTMTPSYSHFSMMPNMVRPSMQPQGSQQTRFDHYAKESSFGPRVVQLPIEQGYNSYQTIVRGGVGPHQVPLSDGSLSHQQVMFQQRSPWLENCYMCQKALPHAHSDTLIQDQREIGSSPVSDANCTYYSIGGSVTRGMGEHNIEPGVGGAQSRVFGHLDSESLGFQHENERVFTKPDNLGPPRISWPQETIGRTGEGRSPYAEFLGTVPQSRQDEVLQKHPAAVHYQIQQDAIKQVNSDVSPTGAAANTETSEQVLQASPQEYRDKPPGIVPNQDTSDVFISYDHLRPIDAKMETLKVSPSDMFVNIDHEKSPIDKPTMEDNFVRKQQPGRDVPLHNNLSKPMVLDVNDNKAAEVLPCPSSQVPHVLNLQPVESHEAARITVLGNPGPYLQSQIGIQPVEYDDLRGKNIQYLGVEAKTVGIPTFVEWKEDPLELPSKIVSSGEASILNGNNPSSLFPPSRPGDIQDSSNSLFSRQGPWNLHLDNHILPPRPDKFHPRREAYILEDPFIENRLGNIGELTKEAWTEGGVHQQLGNSSKNFSLDQSRSAKGSCGSADEQIKQDLQAVAEGVAASILQSSTSNPYLHDTSKSTYEADEQAEVQNNKADVQPKSNIEIKTKLPEKANLGFPVSDGIGRLQIIKNDDLEEIRELGSGTFGTVYYGKWRGTDVAIKRINERCFAGKPSEQDRMREDFWNEAIKLADLHHPNVVAFYGVVLDGPSSSVATVTEYMVNGSLRTALQKNEKSLDKRKRLLIAMDVAFGMEYLHGKNIVHFDLKSDNLLVNLRDPHRPICKVGDLGLSKVKCQTLISGGVRGTLPWMAPELLNGSSSLVSEKVDVFSFGIVLWELLTGEEPYAEMHYGAIIGGIVSNTLRPLVPESCDSEWRSLMERCWSSEPCERPSFTEIANELRSMAAKIPPKGQNQQQQLPSTQPLVQK